MGNCLWLLCFFRCIFFFENKYFLKCFEIFLLDYIHIFHFRGAVELSKLQERHTYQRWLTEMKRRLAHLRSSKLCCTRNCSSTKLYICTLIAHTLHGTYDFSRKTRRNEKRHGIQVILVIWPIAKFTRNPLCDFIEFRKNVRKHTHARIRANAPSHFSYCQYISIDAIDGSIEIRARRPCYR